MRRLFPAELSTIRVTGNGRNRAMSSWLVTVLVIIIGMVILAPLLVGAIIKEIRQTKAKQ
jgi:hypothetical protein